MLMIRLARFGAKKKPTYRLVVIEKERARNSRAVEVVGHYNPVAKPKQLNHQARTGRYWLKNGAQPSDTVKRLLEKNPAVAAEATRGISRMSGPAAPKTAANGGAETTTRKETPSMAGMKELIEDIAKALVDEPEQVAVRETVGEQVTVLELRVAPGDLGKVIGKQGRTARSIRTLLGAAGMKLNRRFNLEILE